MALPMPAHKKLALLKARASLLQAERWLRDQDEPRLADDTAKIVTALNEAYAPKPSPSTAKPTPVQTPRRQTSAPRPARGTDPTSTAHVEEV